MTGCDSAVWTKYNGSFGAGWLGESFLRIPRSLPSRPEKSGEDPPPAEPGRTPSRRTTTLPTPASPLGVNKKTSNTNHHNASASRQPPPKQTQSPIRDPQSEMPVVFLRAKIVLRRGSNSAASFKAGYHEALPLAFLSQGSVRKRHQKIRGPFMTAPPSPPYE